MSKDLLYSDDRMTVNVPKEKRFLNTSFYDYSVNFLIELMKGDNPKIILEVPFQRNFIWKDNRASQLIESVIMNVPIPPLYFAEEENNKWLVIDGLQRLNSILKYSQNEFALEDLEIIKELEGKKYKDLPPKAKSLLDDGLFRINVIKNDSHPDIKYDIFMRLNKGSVSLNYQELRNCLYRGALNDLAKEFVEENNDFQVLLKLKAPHDRYLDVEFIMRVFALQDKLMKNEHGDYEVVGYNGRMVNFINDFMDTHKKISLEEARAYFDNFNGTIEKVVSVFGHTMGFKDPTAKAKRFNRSIAEFICISFSLYDIDTLVQNRVRIVQLLINLLTEDFNFKKSISQKTSDTGIVNYRLNTWLKNLENVLQV